MKIRVRSDERLYSGTPKEILENMRLRAIFESFDSFSEYLQWLLSGLGADSQILKGIKQLTESDAAVIALSWLISAKHTRLEIEAFGIDPWAIKIIRKSRGWSQETLAANIGVSFSTINRWENNPRSRITRVMLHALQLIADFQEPLNSSN